MKKAIIQLLFVFGLMPLFFSCKGEIETIVPPEGGALKVMTFHVKDAPSGRMALLDGECCNLFTRNEQAGEDAFSGLARESSWYAVVFPYDATYVLEYGAVSLSIPEVQTVVEEDTPDTAADIRIARTSSADVDLVRGVAVVRFSFAGESVAQAVLSAMGGEKLSGEVAASFSDPDDLYLVDVPGGENHSSVTLEPGSPDGLQAETGYCFAVLPGTFDGGLRMGFVRLSDGKQASVLFPAVTSLEAGSVTNLGVVDIDWGDVPDGTGFHEGFVRNTN